MPGGDPLTSQRAFEYQSAIRTALQHLRVRNCPSSVYARYVGLLDSCWKAISEVEDKKVQREVLRAAVYSVLYREHGAERTEWPRVGLGLDAALARLDVVIGRAEKVGLAPRMLRMATALRRRLANSVTTKEDACEGVAQ